MFDPAASLIKTMGLVLPAESAGSVIPAVPGDGGEMAGNGGFASLLATKIDAAAPNAADCAAAGLLPELAVKSSAPATAAPAPSDLPAKALPATGKMLPLDLPVALPLAGEAKADPAAAKPEQASEAAQSPGKASPPASIRRVAPARQLTAVAIALSPQPAEEAPHAVDPVSAEAVRPLRAAPQIQATAAKSRPAMRSAETDLGQMTDAAGDEQAPAAETPAGEPAELSTVDTAPVTLAAAPAVLASPTLAQDKPAGPLDTAPRARASVLVSKVANVARDVAPEIQRAEAPQQVQAPQQPQAAQATIRIAAAPATARTESEPAPLPAAPAREAEPASEVTPAVAPRTAQPFALLSPAMPAQAPLTLSAMPSSAAQAPTDFAQIVDRLVAAREAVAPAEVRVTLDHAQFGKVSVGFTPDASGMNVTLTAADPEFARAVEAAVPFAPSVTTETQPIPAPAASRGADLTSAFTGQQGQQAGRQPPQDARPSGPQANPSARTTDSDEKPGKGRGVFA